MSRVPGFGPRHGAGLVGREVSNASLAATLSKHKLTLEGSLPTDQLTLRADLVDQSGYPLSITADGLANDGEVHETIIELSPGRIRALVAFLQEHFPNAD